MTLYERLQNTALNLLSKYGQEVILQRQISGAYNPVEGEDSEVEIEEYSTVGVLLDYTSTESGLRNQDETLIQVGDKKIIVSASPLTSTPKLSDKILVGADTYTIHNVKQTNPAGTPLTYEIQGRL